LRIVHISDTHLGFSAYSRIEPREGINQREQDVYDAFQQAIDRIIALKPDVVLHAGDLFDNVRPQNRAIDFALRQLLRLSEEGIETVLISGNHSTPRLRETGNIFRIFEHLSHIHPTHRPGHEKLVLGDITIHAVPHAASPPLAQTVGALRPSRETGKNILLLHAGILGSDTYRMDEFNEQTIPIDALSDDWDYVALGHFHEHKRVREGAYYSGSTERLGFGEIGQCKGFVEVELDRFKVTFHELKIREMVDLPEIDASGMASSEILREARAAISSGGIDEKIVRLVVSKVSSDAYRSLDSSAIRRLGSGALHFELRIDPADADKASASPSTMQIGLLADEFRRYISSRDMPEARKNRLMELGTPYLERVQE